MCAGRPAGRVAGSAGCGTYPRAPARSPMPIPIPMPASAAPTPSGSTPPSRLNAHCAPSSGSTRSRASACTTGRSILAEIALDMSRFPTPEQLVSWARAVPAHHPVRAGYPRRQDRQGQPVPEGALGDAAAAAAKTNTFLGERYRRLVKRRGKLKALVAVARSILVIVWHLLADPNARFRDLGPDYHTNQAATQRQTAQPHRPTHRHGLPSHPRTRRLTKYTLPQRGGHGRPTRRAGFRRGRQPRGLRRGESGPDRGRPLGPGQRLLPRLDVRRRVENTRGQGLGRLKGKSAVVTGAARE